jgi:hypothetical protein
VIRLGLRLTLAGGREAAVRLVLLVASVGLGVGLLLIAVAGVNAVNTQNGRYAWLSTGNAATADSAAKTPADPLWWLIRADRFDGQLIGRIDVAATGPTSPCRPASGTCLARVSTTRPPRWPCCCAAHPQTSWRAGTPDT